MAQKYLKAPRDATQISGRHKRRGGAIVRIRPADPQPISATALDGQHYCGIRYVDRYGYFDTVKYLSKLPISHGDYCWLWLHCKYLDIRYHGQWIYPKKGKPYQINIWPWRWRIEIHVPSPEALAFFAQHGDTRVSAAHIARDHTFDDEVGPLAMLQLFTESWVQPHLKQDRSRTFKNGGMSTGRRYKGSYYTGYSDQHCRIDGTADCWHFEHRVFGTKALARANIISPADLLDFDFAEHWASKDRTCLKRIDKATLGRIHRNRVQRTRDQQLKPRDLRLGAFIWRTYAADQFGNISPRQFIRNYGRGSFIGSLANNSMSRVDTGRSLPS